jgi:DNA-binding Lrp family transcriptional regulator
MTEAALLEALRLAARRPTGGSGMRVEEIRDALGMPEARVRNLLRQALEDGTVRRTVRVIEQLNGVPRRVPAYEVAA